MDWKTKICGQIETIIKIGQNTEKSPGDLKELAVNQTPVVWKTLKGVKGLCFVNKFLVK